MYNLSEIEENYINFSKDITSWIHDGISDVDLALLQELGILHFQPSDVREEDTLTRYFHVIESSEKITLINEQFVIWIVPENVAGAAITKTLIAINEPKGLHLEAAFYSSGVYNSSWLVLRVLERFLQDIQENEELIKRFQAA